MNNQSINFRFFRCFSYYSIEGKQISNLRPFISAFLFYRGPLLSLSIINRQLSEITTILVVVIIIIVWLTNWKKNSFFFKVLIISYPCDSLILQEEEKRKENLSVQCPTQMDENQTSTFRTWLKDWL